MTDTEDIILAFRKAGWFGTYLLHNTFVIKSVDKHEFTPDKLLFYLNKIKVIRQDSWKQYKNIIQKFLELKPDDPGWTYGGFGYFPTLRGYVDTILSMESCFNSTEKGNIEYIDKFIDKRIKI
uniref:Uncharacterized protein n=1 Tax=viral metagenome TaxID=1070528 RepID=A0A6C0J4L9_9ZZZZ